jgi:hypothetical protein
MILAGVLVAGFAFSDGMTVAQVQDSDIATFRQRVTEYWAARVARDYSRQRDLSQMPPILTGPEMLVWEKGYYEAGKGTLQYLGYAVGDAKIDGCSATVQVEVTTRIVLPKSKAKPVVRTMTVADAWIKVDGLWYRRADQPVSTIP